jgi:hypothetical protein
MRKRQNLFQKKRKKKYELQKTFLVAVLAVLLTSSYFLFSTTSLTKPELHKQKHSDYQITQVLLNAASK